MFLGLVQGTTSFTVMHPLTDLVCISARLISLLVSVPVSVCLPNCLCMINVKEHWSLLACPAMSIAECGKVFISVY